ncbi:hypothetical protein DRP05_14280 [Archaeoglobales archaeon]|nr:MAG: hypothetical protein DRP05_14280 [Archaeoglobales archaeon]
MEIIPIAFDSFGARSMATFVKTKDVSIVVDPSVALGPSRYNLPPHPLEYERKRQLWEKIKEFVSKSDVVVITHYHYDHHNPNEVEIFSGIKLLIKHPKEKINRSQRNRANFFLEQLKPINVEVDFCDSKSYEFGNTLLKISNPVFHGANDRLGYVVEVFVDAKTTFLFSSDVEGPIHEHQLEFMLECDAETVFIDGPMTYMLGYRYSAKNFENSVKNMKRLIEKTSIKNLILDHHLTRDLKWREKLKEVFEFGEKNGVKVLSAAEFVGREDDLLEAKRKELYKKYPVK